MPEPARELSWLMQEGQLRHTVLSQRVIYTSLIKAHFQSQVLSLCPWSHNLPLSFWRCNFCEYFKIQAAMPGSYCSAALGN